MEPHREEPQRAPPGAEQKAKRFRIVKLEERIAPMKPGHAHGHVTQEGPGCQTYTGCYSAYCVYPSGTFNCY
jgi:hypothetical protein